MGRESVPRGLDCTSEASCSSLIFLLPSKATRPMTGFSTTTTTSRLPARLILTSWNKPVSINALRPSSIAPWSRRPFASPLKYERIVSISTRRLPWTSIEDTVWAATGDETSETPSVATAGAANIISAASTPPRSRIPTFMRNAPLSFQCRLVPPRSGRIPFVASLVANFAQTANNLLRCNFIFIPRRCLSATPVKYGIRRQSDAGCRYRWQTPSTSAQALVRSETPSPAPGPTKDDRARPQPHRTKDDRHRATAPETGSATRSISKEPGRDECAQQGGYLRPVLRSGQS